MDSTEHLKAWYDGGRSETGDIFDNPWPWLQSKIVVSGIFPKSDSHPLGLTIHRTWDLPRCPMEHPRAWYDGGRSHIEEILPKPCHFEVLTAIWDSLVNNSGRIGYSPSQIDCLSCPGPPKGSNGTPQWVVRRGESVFRKIPTRRGHTAVLMEFQ